MAIAHRAGDVLDRLPEELLEEDEEEAQASEQLWDLMSWVREKAKGLLELLEVTRDKCPDTEVVNGDVPHQILAEIVARAELEARGGTRNARTSHGGTRNARTSHGGTRNARTSHVEAACSFIHATRQVEELLRPILAPRLGSGSWAIFCKHILCSHCIYLIKYVLSILPSVGFAAGLQVYILHLSSFIHRPCILLP